MIGVLMILRNTGQRFGAAVDKLTGSGKTCSLALARQVAMWLTRKHTRLSLVEIGQVYGGRCHGTVIHACRVVERRMAEDPEFRAEVDRLEAEMLAVAERARAAALIEPSDEVLDAVYAQGLKVAP